MNKGASGTALPTTTHPPSSPAPFSSHCNSNTAICEGGSKYSSRILTRFPGKQIFIQGLSFSLSRSISHLQRSKFLFSLYKSLAWNLISVATLYLSYFRDDCWLLSIFFQHQEGEKWIWLSIYFLSMNYSALRRMLWFRVIMGGPEMARRPAPPHIYFKLWHSLCHARSGKHCHCREKPSAMGSDGLEVHTNMPSAPLGLEKSSYCWSLPLCMFTLMSFNSNTRHTHTTWMIGILRIKLHLKI